MINAHLKTSLQMHLVVQHIEIKGDTLQRKLKYQPLGRKTETTFWVFVVSAVYQLMSKLQWADKAAEIN